MAHTTEFLIPFWTSIIAGILARVFVRKKSICLLNRFREVGAISKEHPIPLKEIAGRDSWIFDRLVTGKVFVAVSEGRYYLDEEALINYRQRQGTKRLIVLGLVILASLFSYFFVFLR